MFTFLLYVSNVFPVVNKNLEFIFFLEMLLYLQHKSKNKNVFMTSSIMFPIWTYKTTTKLFTDMSSVGAADVSSDQVLNQHFSSWQSKHKLWSYINPSAGHILRILIGINLKIFFWLTAIHRCFLSIDGIMYEWFVCCNTLNMWHATYSFFFLFILLWLILFIYLCWQLWPWYLSFIVYVVIIWNEKNNKKNPWLNLIILHKN